jgi:hypothetical protein
MTDIDLKRIGIKKRTQRTLLENRMKDLPDFLIEAAVPVNISYTNFREYRRGNQKWTMQGNWQHMVHKTKTDKTNTQHIMCWTPLYANKHDIQFQQVDDLFILVFCNDHLFLFL